MGFWANLFKKRKNIRQNEIEIKKTEEKESAKLKKKASPTQKHEEKKSTNNIKRATGFFDLKKSKDGRYIFNLYAANNVIIATSQTYSSVQGAHNGIKSIIANAQKAEIEDQTLKSAETKNFPKWEIYIDKSGEYRFRLSASNGNCICHSQGYKSKSSCKNGIESIIRTAKDAKINKSYLDK